MALIEKAQALLSCLSARFFKRRRISDSEERAAGDVLRRSVTPEERFDIALYASLEVLVVLTMLKLLKSEVSREVVATLRGGAFELCEILPLDKKP
jgi:hypothetical protein